MIDRILLFGGSGDLTGRYLMPALAQLHQRDRLPDHLQVVGVGRDEWSDDDFCEFVAERLDRHGADLPDGTRRAFLKRLAWRRADVTDPGRLRALVGESQRPVVVYLALPPSIYAATIDGLCEAGLPDGSRLVAEKPFGTDLDSARDLNRRISRLLPEEAVFRVDHFLAKQTVQNVLGLRFANRVFEPLWNRAHVDRVELTWDETLGLEGRAGYYDHTGALRDMLQNHLLQLLALVAMEPPVSMTERDLRDRKLDVLRATRAMRPGESRRPSVRARYTAGVVGGRSLPDYVAEEGVDPSRGTETYAETTLTVENWRWAGVPFILRSGKALAADRTEIAVRFAPVPHSAFAPPGSAQHNVLRLLVDPDRISLNLNLNGEGDPFALEPAELAASFAPQDLPAYARLLLDILDGDPTLSIRDDEAEEAWRIMAPILASWQRGEVTMRTYPAGSTGPTVD